MGCGSSQPSVPANGVPVHDASAQPKSSAMSPGKTSGSPVKKVAFSGAKPGKGSAGKEKVALVGSGNWGSAIATKIGRNVLSNTMFDKEVMMWVFEEYVKEEDGKWVRPARGAQPPEGKTWVDEGYEPLTEVINRLNENVIYLPGIKLPKSIVATPDIKKCVTGATMMVNPNPYPNPNRHPVLTLTLNLALTLALALALALNPALALALALALTPLLAVAVAVAVAVARAVAAAVAGAVALILTLTLAQTRTRSSSSRTIFLRRSCPRWR